MPEGILHGIEQFDPNQYEQFGKSETADEMETFIDHTVERLAGADEVLKRRLVGALDGHEPAGNRFGDKAAQAIDAAGSGTLRERLAAAFVRQDPKDVLSRKDNAEDLLAVWVDNMRSPN